MKYQFKLSAAWVGVSALLLVVGLAIPAQAIQVVRNIAGANDDAEEVLAFPGDDVVGRVDVGSSDLELGREGPTAGDAQPQLVGVRFLDITIPAGAIITSATLAFEVDKNEKDEGPLTVIITGELDPNPLEYIGTASEIANFNISSRNMTANSVLWDIPTWAGDLNVSGPDQTSTDLSVIVQELIGQGGWASGNAMAFMLAPTPLVELGGIREAEGNGPTQLTIDYDVIPEPTSAVLALLGLATFVGAGRSRRQR